MPTDRLNGVEPLIALRVALLVLAGILVLLPPPARELAPAPTAQARPGAAGPPPVAWVRRDATAPNPAELDHLAALAGAAPLFAVLPAGPHLLGIPPAGARAGRNAAVDWRLEGGAPGDTVRVQLSDAGGVLDSAHVVLDATGAARGAFRVRPERSGWHAWSLSTPGTVAHAGAWVLPAAPLRVLLAAAAGSVEGREVARAMERGGAAVTLATDLGRGLTPGDAPPGVPERPPTDAFDVIVVLAGAPIGPAQAVALRTFVRAGGGVLVAGRTASVLSDVAVGDAEIVDPDDIVWSAPAAVEPLPAIAESVERVPIDAVGESVVAATVANRGVLVLGADGRGRNAALGLTATWPWALRAGRTDALSAFWTSLAVWLAGGATQDLAVSIDPATAPPGLAIAVRLDRLGDDAPRPDSLVIAPAVGAPRVVRVSWSDDHGEARFVAAGDGPVEIRLAEAGAVLGGHLADTHAPPAPDAWARLAELAWESDGALVPADSLDTVLPDTAGREPRRILIALLVLVAMGDWATRRLRGRA